MNIQERLKAKTGQRFAKKKNKPRSKRTEICQHSRSKWLMMTAFKFLYQYLRHCKFYSTKKELLAQQPKVANIWTF